MRDTSSVAWSGQPMEGCFCRRGWFQPQLGVFLSRSRKDLRLCLGMRFQSRLQYTAPGRADYLVNDHPHPDSRDAAWDVRRTHSGRWTSCFIERSMVIEIGVDPPLRNFPIMCMNFSIGVERSDHLKSQNILTLITRGQEGWAVGRPGWLARLFAFDLSSWLYVDSGLGRW